jgi:hypothetical protein
MSAAPGAEARAEEASRDSAESASPSEAIGARGLAAAGAPVIAGLFAATVYGLTAAPGAWWGDGLELTAAAKVLGIPHPTGYPLYTVVGHLLIHGLSGIDAGRVMTLFSAGLCAAATAMIGLAVFAVLREGRGEAEPGEAERTMPRPSAALVALGAALVSAFSYTLWDHATYAEVYPLTLALVGAMTLVAIRTGRGGEAPGAGSVALLALLAGLGALNHYSVAVAGPLVLLSVVAWGRRRNRLPLYASVFLAVFAVCLSGYAYLPWRAAANPPLNFGNPDSLSGLFWTLRGGQYGRLFLPGLEELAPQIARGTARWARWWGVQVLGPGRPEAAAMALGTALAVTAMGGQALLAVHRRAAGVGALAGMIVTLIIAIVYRIPDVEGFFLPALPLAALGWAELIRRLCAMPVRPLARQAAGVSIGAGLILGALGLLTAHARAIDKSWDRGPAVWAERALAAIPEDGLILTRQGYDSEIYALWYAQMVEGKRPDVSVYGTGFIFSGWYGKYFEAEGRPKIPVFATERAPGTKEAYDVALIGGVIVPNLKERRVFTTYLDATLEQYFAPRAVGTLLPAEYYESTAYRLNPPGRVLYELRRNLQIEPLAERRFREMFGSSPESG